MPIDGSGTWCLDDRRGAGGAFHESFSEISFHISESSSYFYERRWRSFQWYPSLSSFKDSSDVAQLSSARKESPTAPQMISFNVYDTLACGQKKKHEMSERSICQGNQVRNIKITDRYRDGGERKERKKVCHTLSLEGLIWWCKLWCEQWFEQL